MSTSTVLTPARHTDGAPASATYVRQTANRQGALVEVTFAHNPMACVEVLTYEAAFDLARSLLAVLAEPAEFHPVSTIRGADRAIDAILTARAVLPLI